MEKMKNFRVVVETVDDEIFFDSFNKKQQVEKCVDSFTAKENTKTVKIYELNDKRTNYTLTCSLTKKSEIKTRMVGFGRW